jgi:hypothetical protein
LVEENKDNLIKQTIHASAPLSFGEGPGVRKKTKP